MPKPPSKNAQEAAKDWTADNVAQFVEGLLCGYGATTRFLTTSGSEVVSFIPAQTGQAFNITITKARGT